MQVLHQSRHHQTKSDPDTFQWLEQLKQQGLLYITPHKMNDDMFWMYAPIRGRAASRLVRRSDRMWCTHTLVWWLVAHSPLDSSWLCIQQQQHDQHNETDSTYKGHHQPPVKSSAL